MVVASTGFPGSSAGKESTCNAGDPGLISGSGRSTGEGTGYPLQYFWASLVAQLVKNLPAMRETWVRSLGCEDPLEKGKITHSSILAWRISWTIYSPWGCKASDMTEQLSLSFSFLIIRNSDGKFLFFCENLLVLLTYWFKGKCFLVIWDLCIVSAHQDFDLGTFLLIQWLRICLPMQGHGLALWLRKIPHATGN